MIALSYILSYFRVRKEYLCKCKRSTNQFHIQRSPLRVEESVEDERETRPPVLPDSDSSGVEYESATDNEETLVVDSDEEEEARGDARLEHLISPSDSYEPDQVTYNVYLGVFLINWPLESIRARYCARV